MGSWDVLFGLIFAIAGTYIFLEARTFPNLAGGYPGPGLFPQIIGALFVLSGLALAVSAIVRRDWPRQLPLAQYARREKVNASLTILAVLFYIFAVNTLGFIITILVILVAIMLSNRVSPGRTAVFSLLLTLAAHGIFNMALKVPLPQGILQGWL